MEPIIFKSGQSGNKNPNTSNPNPTPPNPGNSDASASPNTGDVNAQLNSAPVNNGSPSEPLTAGMPPQTPDDFGNHASPNVPLPPAKHSKRRMLIIVLLLVLALAIGVFAYFKVNKLAKPAVTTAGEAKKDIAELRLGSDQFPFNNFYPNPNFVAGGSFSVNFQVYEGLVGFQDATRVVPLLAESWTNPDNSTWIFKLKSGVKFHDGKTVTAQDVKRSIDAAVKNKDTIQLLISTIDSVAVEDESHVVVKTKTPDAILLNKLAYLFVQSTEKVQGMPLGTGAYRLNAEDKVTEKSVKLVAFDDHHLGRPSVRKISYTAFEGEEGVQQAVKEGKIDISDFLTKTGLTAPAVAGFQKPLFNLGDISYIGINAEDEDSPTSKLEVRQALRLALDPADFIKKSGRSGSVPTQMTVKANFGYNSDLQVPKRDVVKAKELLTKAGYPEGVSLKLHYYASESNKKQFAILKAQAAEANITLVDDGSVADDAPFANIDSGTTELYYLTSTSALVDSYDLFAYNFRSANFDSAALNDLLDKSNAEFDATKRKALLQQASKVIVDEVAAVPLVENNSAYYVKNGLNYQIDPAGYAMGGYIRTITTD